MFIYFTPTSPHPFEPFIDPYNYYFPGEETLVPPYSLVICIPCQNIEPEHVHNIQDCKLLTYHRGWDEVQPNDFVTIYVVDNTNTTLYLENGELLSTFLTYNSECFNVGVDKCVMGVNPFWGVNPYGPIAWIGAENAEDLDDDGYESNESNMSV